MPDPIWMKCEGSGCPTNRGFCQMCGAPVTSDVGGYRQIDGVNFVAGHHVRKDILAMIDRGDFGADDA